MWRRFKIFLSQKKRRGKTPPRPHSLYHDFILGDIEQGMRLVEGYFRLQDKDYPLPHKNIFKEEWPLEIKRWLYSFIWLRDLHAFGTADARLKARALILQWVHTPSQDEIASHPHILGQRLAYILGHYEFCLLTAQEDVQKNIMAMILREAHLLSVLLPLPLIAWENLSALRGLFAAFMAFSYKKNFYKNFYRDLPLELNRLILPDGSAQERSPEAQFQIVHELVSLSSMFTSLSMASPPLLQEKIKQSCAVLRALCHHDGALALFNGSYERSAKEITLLLDRAERYRIISPILPNAGFIRLTSGRSLLLVDSAVPPNLSSTAHASTLAFEFSDDMQRIFVNSGTHALEPFKSLLRESVAHNLTTIEGASSSSFTPKGEITSLPSHATSDHYHQDGKDWLEAFHDGYYPTHRALYYRQFYLEKEGSLLKGLETITAQNALKCVTRFYLHPTLEVHQEEEDLILSNKENIWRFRIQGGQMSVEDALYFGRGLKEKNKQIVIRSQLHHIDPEDPNQPPHQQNFLCRISWLLERVPT